MDPDRATDTPADRLFEGGQPDVHNASVDENKRQDGACAQIHLPTGRTCTLRNGHPKSCDFAAPDQVEASMARHRAADGW
jgi:hypothetical protein